MKYPYIGKSRTTPVTVLFTSRFSGFCFSSGKYSRCWNEAVFDDVTSVFLSDKKIEVNSPFESKLIQLAVFKAGGETRAGGKEPVNSNAPFILISKDIQVTFEDDQSFFDAYKMGGIKLPKFDNPSEFVFPELEHPIKHFDCVCTKCGGRCCIGSCDDWPKVGDEVEARHDSGQVLKGELLAITNEYAIIQQVGHEQYLHLSAWKFSKPKTPEQELLDELHAHFEKYTFSDQAINELPLKYNITKKGEGDE